MFERPGAQLPWKELNQLLNADERIELQLQHQKGFLLAPKHSSTCAALFYLIRQLGIDFELQGRGTTICSSRLKNVMISARAMKEVTFHENDVVEVGAGCTLSQLQQYLLERKQETSLEEGIASTSKRSIGGLILSGLVTGLHYRQETFSESILGMDIVTKDGSQIRLGSQHRNTPPGPTIHKLMWGMQTLPGLVVRIMIKTYPIPQSRLRMRWSFQDKNALVDHLQALKMFSYSWEYLDCVQSGQANERAMIFAQISGSDEEMKAFSHHCPSYHQRDSSWDRTKIKTFIKEKNLNYYSTSLNHLLEPGEYLWSHELDKKAWWITSQRMEQKTEFCSLWKERLMRAFVNDS